MHIIPENKEKTVKSVVLLINENFHTIVFWYMYSSMLSVTS